MSIFLNPSAVHLTGFVGERWRANAEGIVLQKDESALLEGFRHRPGAQAWVGEHVGKWIDAARRIADLEAHDELEAKIKRVVDGLIETQEEDGYLGTYRAAERWTEWDVWVHKYALLGLCAQARSRSCARSFDAARKIVALLTRRFDRHIDELFEARVSTHRGMAAASVIGALMHCHALDADAASVQLAQRIAEGMERDSGPRIVSALLEHGDVTRVANGKAYELLSCLLGLLKLHHFRPHADYLRAAEIAVADIVAHHRYPSGGSSHHEYYTHRSDWSAAGAVSETCVVVTWIELCDALWNLTGREIYLSEIQRAWMNALLAAQRPDGMAFCYFTPLTGKKPYDAGITCCTSSGARGIAMAPRWFAKANAEEVHYLACATGNATLQTADGNVEIEARGDFHRGERCTIRVARGSTNLQRLRVRKPGPGSRLEDHGSGVRIAEEEHAFTIAFGERRTLSLSLHWDAPLECLSGSGQQRGESWRWQAPWLLCTGSDGTTLPFASAGARGDRYSATSPELSRTPIAARAAADGPGTREGALDSGEADVLWSAQAAPGSPIAFYLHFDEPQRIHAIQWRHAVPRWQVFGFAADADGVRIEIQRHTHAAWELVGHLPAVLVGLSPELRVDPPHGRCFRVAWQPIPCVGVRVIGRAPESGEVFCGGLCAERAE